MADVNKVIKLVDAIGNLASVSNKGLRFAPVKTGKITVPIGKITYAPKMKAVASADDVASNVSALSRKDDILAKYASEKGFDLDDITNQFNNAEKYLDEVSLEQLLKYADDGDMKIFASGGRCFGIGIKNTDINLLSFGHSRPLVKFLNVTKYGDEVVANAQYLKELLALARQGKISPQYISNVMKTGVDDTGAIADLVAGLRSGIINDKNLNTALLLANSGLSAKFFYIKNLDDLSIAELKNLRNIVAGKGSNKTRVKALAEQKYREALCELDIPLLPKDLTARQKVLAKIVEKLSASVRVNNVSPQVSDKFAQNFSNVEKAFMNATGSIDDLARAGGVQLRYSRDIFKQNIMGQISHLPTNEQAKILEKFGLIRVSDDILGGIPVHIQDTKGLSQAELAINNEIDKFLFQNKVVLPKGFENYQMALDDIVEAFPEFMYTIGSRQHGEHALGLSEHILKVFEQNMKNPLYKNLNAQERRILGVSTILHDLNKTEKIVDDIHSLISSKSTISIMDRFSHLSLNEKDRIINLVENHHWLTRIDDVDNFNMETVKDIAFKFRSGNDFTMAKIFAESDLKGVNAKFWKDYGGKINCPITRAIEENIAQLQMNGKAIFTADITMVNALKNGGTRMVLGTGAEQTNNVVVRASQMGLNEMPVLYHAPATDDAFTLMMSGMGYGREGVFSLTLGKNGRSAVFQKRPEFMLFRRPNMNNVTYISVKNGNTGVDKTYRVLQKFAFEDIGFSEVCCKNYAEIIGKTMSRETYGKLYREISSLENPYLIHQNKVVQQILGGQDEAMAFEKAIIKTNNHYICKGDKTTVEISEAVAGDLRAGGIGTNRQPQDMSFSVRKLCEEYNLPIVIFD